LSECRSLSASVTGQTNRRDPQHDQ
jgi:hypothetical protein